MAQFEAAESGLAVHRVLLSELMALGPHRLGAEAERVLASLGEVLNAPYMVYSRSKSVDIQFAPFTNAAGEQFTNSINGFESDYESHSDTSAGPEVKPQHQRRRRLRTYPPIAGTHGARTLRFCPHHHDTALGRPVG